MMINTEDRGAVLEAAAKYLYESLLREPSLESPRLTANYLKAELVDDKHETFGVLFLDTRHRPIAFERMFYGTIDGATVYPRVVCSRALELNAAALILAHNHPSGMAEPSLADQAITRRLQDALGLLDIRVLDHFVIGDGEPVSMAERGLIK